MKLITIKENWPIRVAKHKVLYRKAFILNELDKIILSFLYLHNDIIGFNELGSILGFAVSDNRDEQVYFDIAEAEIFSSLLDTLLTYHLISTHKNGDDVLMISTTHWGIEARLSGVKHLFYEGIIGLNEHYLLYDWESCDSLFEFSKHGIFSEVGNSKEVTPYLIDLEEQKKNIFLKRALLNIDKNQEENKNIEVQWVNEAILHYEELVSNLSLSLMKWDAVHSIQIVLNASPSPELDGIILQASNSNLYFNWLLLLRYQVYLRDTKVIQADEIVQYSPQVNWEMIQRDSRIVWDNDWFQLMSSDNVTSTSVWREIIQNCPDEILLLNIEAYVDYWDWSRLSMKAEIAYIVKSINRFPWDLDICLERIEPNDLEQLLTTIKDPSAIQDWVKVTKRVSFEFIESNIRLLPFDLHIIGSSGEIQSGQIILNNPQLNWDWSLISRQYPIIYLILYIDTLSPYIDIVAVVHRILTSEMEFTMSFNDLRFGQYLIDNIRRTDFKIGKDQRVILNPETFRFLSDNDLLFWGNEQVPGIEANQNLKWSSELFENYSSLVKNQDGYDHVSVTIESIDLIEGNESFHWNFKTICSRKDLKWSFEFIRKHQDKLILNILINNIPSVIVADNLAFFIQWATEKELLGLMSKYVSTQFVFEQIVLNRILLISHNIKINWELVLGVAPLKSLNDIAFLNEDELLELPSADALRTYLSSKCEIDFILNNSDLFWDWEHLTSQRIDTDKFKNDKFVIDYSKYLFWPFVIKEHYTVEELTQEEKLNPLAILLQNASETVRVKAWNEITRKIPFNNLISVIEKYNNEIQFQWDWDYISSSKFIPINRRFLSMYSDKINWKFLSNNSTLSSFFQFSKVVYQGVQQWLDRTLEYLHAYKEKWDFTSLSTVNNITWNEQIIYEFEEAWDWQILSALSPLLTNLNKETKIIEYDKSRLNRFARLLDWGVLSNRFEVTLSPKLVGKYCNQPWDWGKLSSHPRFTLTKDFILENCSKPWDFHALSSHRHLKIDKDFLLQLKEENWDFNLISKEGWIDNDLLLTFSDRKWNWALLSSNTNLIFDINLLEQFVLQDDSNWNKILLSDSLHITPGTLQLLESNNIVNSDHWDSLSIHQNLDFQQHPQLLTAYKKKWNWGGLIKCWKPDFNDLTILSDYEDYINWNLLCNSEKFSPSQEVLLKFKQLLNWKVLSKRIVFDINSLRLFKDYLDWEYISKDQSINFTTEMIEEFKSFWDYYYLRENIAVSISSRNKVFEIIDSIPELKFYFKLKEQNSHWAGYIYHFTLLDNAINILRVKKILSRTKAAKIGFYDSASPQVVSSNNVPHKYTRFYLRPQTPYQYYSQDMGKDKNSKENTFNHFVSLGRPKCPITVIFKFNLQEIILKKKYGQEFEITNGNAHRRGVKRGLISDVYKYFNYQDVFSTIDDTTDNKWRTYKDCSQQEFLIENEFDFSDINDFNVIVQSESDRVQLLSQMESEFEFVNNRVIIDKSQKYLHKLNPKLRYEYYESILSVDLLYTFEYENHFNFILEFEKPEKYQVNGGNILNLTDTKITFKSKININIDQNIKFKILLVDNLKKEICPIFSNSEEQSKVSSRFITIGQNLTELELV